MLFKNSMRDTLALIWCIWPQSNVCVCVCVCVCLFVCAIAKHPKDISLILAYNDTILLIFFSFIDFKLLNYLFFLF